jgi:signal peptidase I
MAPTLKPGDWILVERVKNLSQFSASELGDFLANLIGEIVVIEQGGREQIKRLKSLAKRSDGSIWLEVLGDNPEFSTDSRHFGLIEASALKGIFYRRYGKRKEKRVARIK